MIDFSKLPRFKSVQYRIFELVDQWAEAYGVPREAILRQIPIAHAWQDSNPKRAPRKDQVRFLFNWMRKAKEHGNLVTVWPNNAYREQRTADEETLTGEDFARMRQAIRRPTNA